MAREVLGTCLGALHAEVALRQRAAAELRAAAVKQVRLRLVGSLSCVGDPVYLAMWGCSAQQRSGRSKGGHPGGLWVMVAVCAWVRRRTCALQSFLQGSCANCVLAMC